MCVFVWCEYRLCGVSALHCVCACVCVCVCDVSALQCVYIMCLFVGCVHCVFVQCECVCVCVCVSTLYKLVYVHACVSMYSV